MSKTTAWIRELNRLGRHREPFLSIMDFEQRHPRVWPLASLDPERVRYQFHDRTNAAAFPSEELPEPFTFLPRYPDERTYRRAFEIVQAGLQRGDSFLTNLAFPTLVTTDLSLAQIYAATTARYRLYLADRFVCFSPETFVRIDPTGRISSHPMKGTAPVSASGPGALLADEKERAEHATIVDLIRNDLSRVAKRVRVVDYRYVEVIEGRQGGLYQTSSEIAGQLGPDWPERLGDIFARLLPAGSVSGAPKPKTLELIRAAEGQDRGDYCGVAVLFDGQTVDSGVLIRLLEQTPEGMRYWSGGGVTARSTSAAEYGELCAKVYLPVRQPILR